MLNVDKMRININVLRCVSDDADDADDNRQTTRLSQPVLPPVSEHQTSVAGWHRAQGASWLDAIYLSITALLLVGDILSRVEAGLRDCGASLFLTIPDK